MTTKKHHAASVAAFLLVVVTTTTTTLLLMAGLSVGLTSSSHSDARSSSSSTRRGFLSRVAWTSAATATGGGLTTGFAPFAAEPAGAVSGLDKVNSKLKGLGLPTMAKVPDGFIPLAEIYGKTGGNRFPLLITFAHPLTWVVTLPSNDANGEDGTIQAGEYAKGDTATLFVYSEPGHVNDITTQPKELFEKTLIKAISQKGDNMYQNFKVTKLEPVTTPDNQKYMFVDFKYQLLTGAGFEVDRKGVASITSEGNAVEALWSASTAVRYKKTEPTLRDIVATFRCYSEGIQMAEELTA